MKTKNTLSKYLQDRLIETRGLHGAVTAATGVPWTTLQRIAGGACSPRLETAEALLNVFGYPPGLPRQSRFRAVAAGGRAGAKRTAASIRQ